MRRMHKGAAAMVVGKGRHQLESQSLPPCGCSLPACLSSFTFLAKNTHIAFLYSPDISLQVLVGNKSDMDESKRAVAYSRGQALADEFRMQFFETSAKNNTNVDEVFQVREVA